MIGMFLMAFVVAPADALLVKFKDAVGRRSTVKVWVATGGTSPDSTGPAAIVTGLAGVSDALIDSAELLRYATNASPGEPEEDPYDRPTDKLELVLLGNDGVPTMIKLPSVKEEYYQGDKQTPLTTAGPAKTLMDLIKSTCVTADGKPLTTISRARRMIPKRLKTWNKKGSI